MFCGWGELAVYEYTCERHGFRRWKVGQEREELDRELGIPEAELSKLTYRRGQVPDGSLRCTLQEIQKQSVLFYRLGVVWFCRVVLLAMRSDIYRWEFVFFFVLRLL